MQCLGEHEKPAVHMHRRKLGIYNFTFIALVSDKQCKMNVSAMRTYFDHFRRKYHNFAFCIMYFVRQHVKFQFIILCI